MKACGYEPISTWKHLLRGEMNVRDFISLLGKSLKRSWLIKMKDTKLPVTTRNTSGYTLHSANVRFKQKRLFLSTLTSEFAPWCASFKKKFGDNGSVISFSGMYVDWRLFTIFFIRQHIVRIFFVGRYFLMYSSTHCSILFFYNPLQRFISLPQRVMPSPI